MTPKTVAVIIPRISVAVMQRKTQAVILERPAFFSSLGVVSEESAVVVPQ